MESLEQRVLLASDLLLTKVDSADPVEPGQAFDYTISISNIGDAVAADVTLTDTLPAGVDFISVVSSQGTANESGGVVTGALGSLDIGATATVTISVTANTGPATVTNSASVTTSSAENSTANNSDSEDTTVNAPSATAADLQVTKTESADPVTPGQALTYTIDVSNIGATNAAADVTLTDTISGRTSFVSATTSQGTVSESGGIVTADLGSLAAGASATVTITVSVTRIGTLRNTATATTSSGDVDTSNNTDTVTTTANAVSATAADISVTKSDAPNQVVPGEPLVYTIDVSNIDTVDSAADVVVTDVLPSGVTFISATTSQGSISQSSGTVTASLGTLAAGGTATITITVTPSAPGTLTNTVSATTSSGDVDTSNNSDAETTTVNQVPAAAADLAVTKSDSPDPVTAGQALMYTIDVSNIDTVDAAADVTLTDVLPAGVTFVSASASQGTVSQSGGIVTADLGTIAAGAGATVTIVVMPTTTGTLTNTATATTSSGDSDVTNNTDTESTTADPVASTAADLLVTKTDAPDPVTAGQSLTYTIDVSNIDTVDAALGVTLTDVLPAGVTFVSASASQGTVSQAGGVVTADLGTIAAGAGATVTIIVTPTTTGTLTNTATATTSSGDSDVTNNTDIESTTVDPVASTAADLLVTKTDTPDPVIVGQTLTYTIDVSNIDTVDAALGVTLTDVLPAGVSFVSASASQGTVSQSGGIVTADLGTIAAGAGATVTIIVTPTTTGTLSNTATATTSSGDSDVTNNSDTELTTVNPATSTAADLLVTKTDAPDPVTLGQSLTYTIDVSNIDTVDAAAGVTLTDVLPAGVTFVSASATQGTVSQSGGVVTADLGTIAAGAGATVTIIVTPTTTGTLSNTATATTSSGDSDPTNNSDTELTTVNPAASTAADLLVTKTDAPDPVTAGQALTYTIDVNNIDTVDAALGVTLTDVLPAGVTFVSASASQGTVSQSGGVVTANLGTIAAGAGATVTIIVAPTTTGTLSNTATATTSSGDSDVTNNSDTELTTVNPAASTAADLLVTKTDSADPITVGDSLTYTINVSNIDTVDPAADVTLTDVLPAGVTFVSASTSQGTLTQSGGVVTANLGTLGAGASATVTILVTATSAGAQTNSATATTSSGDVNTANNTDTETTTVNAVTGVVDLSIAKFDSPDPVNVGQPLTYTINVTNTSTTDSAADVTVTDVLPGGVTFVSASASQGSASQSGGVVTANLGTLAAGASATVTIVVTPGASGFLTNTASVATSSTDPNSANNSDTEGTTVVTVTPPPSPPGVCPVIDADMVPRDGTESNFIRNLYEDILDRAADPAGFQYWQSILAQNGDDQGARREIINGFLRSREYVENLVECMYQDLLHRAPDAGGLDFWADQLEGGAEEEDVVEGFVLSPEYNLTHGSNSAFVTGLYNDLLGRAPDSGGQAFWTGKLDSGELTREEVLRGFLESDEFHRLRVDDAAGRATILEAWNQDYLDGQLQPGLVDEFFEQLEADVTWRNVQVDILALPSYYNASQQP